MAVSRLTFSQRRVLEILRNHQELPISYDRLAAMADIDRRTAISVIATLEHRRYLAVNHGRGCKANSYLVIA